MAFECPIKLTDALDTLEGGVFRIIAGGTDVYPAVQKGHMPAAFLNVTRIEGLGEISQEDGHFRIGAAVTWTDVVEADLPPAFDGLKAAAREIGSRQIQNAGTVVGNLCNASPAADGVPPLLALDAKVEIASAARGTRELGLAQFIKGVRSTAIAKDELVTAVLIPDPPLGMASAFEKLGSRRYLVISICMTSANVQMNSVGRIEEARIAVGSCSAVAQRLPELESDLIGKKLADVVVTAEHLSPLSPIDDVRGSRAYRLDAVREQCRRAILKAGIR